MDALGRGEPAVKQRASLLSLRAPAICSAGRSNPPHVRGQEDGLASTVREP
jgi:hypothetical protein